MERFEELRSDLTRVRTDVRSQERRLFLEREKRRKLERRIRELTRQSREDNPAVSVQIRELSAQRDVAERRIRRLVGEVATASERYAATLTGFHAFTDPTERITHLSDRFPFLLFPVRLETRFKEIVSADEPSHQLWVRVYPDDILVDTFEATLAEVELRNARIYWTSVWRAAGDEGGRRAAWASLVKSHGSGRAHWLIQQDAARPLNPQDEPISSAGEFILLIVMDVPLADADEKIAVSAYWRAVWLADGDSIAMQNASDALSAVLGRERAAQLVDDTLPANLSEGLKVDRASINLVRIVFLEMPVLEEQETQEQPWMTGARVDLLPDRFVLLGFSGGEESLRMVGNPIPPELTIGPAPGIDGEIPLQNRDGELLLSDGLKWMVDFDEAIRVGMGFRVDLSGSQAQAGFDRLFVLGVRLSSSADQAAAEFESLIQHHQRSRRGFEILPQGTPTNNTDDGQSGYSWQEDSAQSYEHFFVQDRTDDPDGWQQKKDGRRLADFLGIDSAIMKDSLHYFSTDQANASAMNIALWPATVGYYLDQMLDPLVDEANMNNTRAFFTRFVTGRGPLPAIRIGRQPYGILPTTAFSRISWLTPPERPTPFSSLWAEIASVGSSSGDLAYLSRLYTLLTKITGSWSELADDVSYVGRPGRDAHQTLLDILGLHPASVEFYQRYGQSYEQVYNQLKYLLPLATLNRSLVNSLVTSDAKALLASLGDVAIDAVQLPEIANRLFLQNLNLLKGPLIDDRPLSERDPIRPYHESGQNYIEWLVDAARTSHDTLRRQSGFLEDKTPSALLYLMLRHALDLGYVDASLQLHREAGVLNQSAYAEARREPRSVHIKDPKAGSGSAYRFLYKTEPRITQSPAERIADFIPSILESRNPFLNAQLTALDRLGSNPTAQLERAFVEHLDCCSYRLDAWWQGLLAFQLTGMRSGESQRGLYLGAFGWLEDLRPESRQQRPAGLDEELQAIFDPEGTSPPMTDSSNQGHILAPSLNQAVTGAVLRNGYVAHATPENPSSFAVNLTSKRVRLALDIIEGIRSGHPLGALLGYRLERGLHDEPGLFLDSVIYDLRRVFSLAGNQLLSTKIADTADVAIDAIEARNVVDGLALVKHIQASGNATYPFGLPGRLPGLAAPEQASVDAQIARILDIHDAVADLAMSEGVYQMVQGNYDRATGVLEAFGKGTYPPLPEVVQTPRRGVSLTHRVGLHLQSGLEPDDPENRTPRAKGEPAVNRWLGRLLPDPLLVCCEIHFFDPETATQRVETVTQADLNLLPVDLVYLLDFEDERSSQTLDDLVYHYCQTVFSPRPDVDIELHYLNHPTGKVSFFEIAAYVRSLRYLLQNSRPLKSTDLQLPNDATSSEEPALTLDTRKIGAVATTFLEKLENLEGTRDQLEALLAEIDEAVLLGNAVNQIDQLLLDYVDVMHAMIPFGLPGAGIGFTLDWRRRQFAALLAKVNSRIARWQTKLDAFDEVLSEFDQLNPGLPDAERFKVLLRANREISTQTLTFLPPSPDQLRADLESVQRAAFVSTFQQIQAAGGTSVTIAELMNALGSMADVVALHDLIPLDLHEERLAVIAFIRQLYEQARALAQDYRQRYSQAIDIFTETGAGRANPQIDRLTQSARLLLGDSFLILPEFRIGPQLAAEWRNGWDDQESLLRHLKEDMAIDFPVDGWLYGLARVREMMQHVENVTVMGDILLNDGGFDLVPLQFPYRSPDAWLGLDFANSLPGTGGDPFHIDEDKLLYTAHYDALIGSTDPDMTFCGLLLDEWTELIPMGEEEAGMAFHFDRPNAEPPQALLLVTPPNFDGDWAWQDLVDALHETMDMAKMRGIEPDLLDQTAFAAFLPALISPATTRPITPSSNFLYNNGIQFETVGGTDE